MDFDLLPPPHPEVEPQAEGEHSKLESPLDHLDRQDFARPTEGTEYRVLTMAEIQTIIPVFQERQAELPDLRTSCVVGAVRDGKVIGFLVLQLKLHAQPMWLSPGHEVIFPHLIEASEEAIRQRVGSTYVYLFAEAGKHARLAQRCGMLVEPWVVLSKAVIRPPSADVLLSDDVAERGIDPVEGPQNKQNEPEEVIQ